MTGRDGLTMTVETYSRGEKWPPVQLFLLSGPEGAVQFKVSRHHFADGACDLCKKFRDISHFDQEGNCWQAWDLGYHSRLPRYEGHEPIENKPCHVLGALCYYDGTGLGASELLDRWLAVGRNPEWLHHEMEGWYQDWLQSGDEVFASPATALTVAIDRASS